MKGGKHMSVYQPKEKKISSFGKVRDKNKKITYVNISNFNPEVERDVHLQTIDMLLAFQNNYALEIGEKITQNYAPKTVN